MDAFDILRRDHVIPTPVFHPYVSVGRDYFGPELHGCEGYQRLERELEGAYPRRFSDPLESDRLEFASTYIFSFLEAAVARCGSAGDFTAESDQVSESINDVLALLDSDVDEIVCCRVVSHLTSQSGEPVQVGGVTVVPEAKAGMRSLEREIAREIPAAPAAFNRDPPFVHDPPLAILVAKGKVEDGKPWDGAKALSQSIERFLLHIRLITGGTVRSCYEVSGGGTLVGRLRPELTIFPGGGGPSAIRRTIRLGGSEAESIDAIGSLVDSAAVKREGMVATSIDVAIGKFHSSYRADSGPLDQLVELATAFEATLSSGETDTQGLTLRLRTRAAALLAARDDPARSIFADVGHLYGLRSKLVHGVQIKQADIQRIVDRVSTVPRKQSASSGAPLGHVVDRMRDLVRRAILARLCLATGPDALWPFDAEFSADAQLSDDETRQKWRSAWHETLAEIGAARSGESPRAAANYLSDAEK